MKIIKVIAMLIVIYNLLKIFIDYWVTSTIPDEIEYYEDDIYYKRQNTKSEDE